MQASRRECVYFRRLACFYVGSAEFSKKILDKRKKVWYNKMYLIFSYYGG